MIEIGDIFGKLKIIAKSDKRRRGKILWVCLCECGKEILLDCTNLTRKYGKRCCNCSNKYKNQGYKDISGMYFNSLKNNSKKRNHQFNLKIEDIWNQYIKQNKKCALSGREIKFTHSYPLKTRQEQTASVDRIDSNIGYELDNIQIIHKDINWMKQDFNQQYFINTCKEIARFNHEILCENPTINDCDFSRKSKRGSNKSN